MATTITEEHLKSAFPPQGVDYDEWLAAKAQRAMESNHPLLTSQQVRERMADLHELADRVDSKFKAA